MGTPDFAVSALEELSPALDKVSFFADMNGEII